MPRSNVSRRGFTMVEIMVTIGLFGLLMAISVPSLWGYMRANRLDTQVDMIGSDLAYARSIAVARGRIIRVTATSTGYTVTDAASGDVVKQRQFDGEVRLSADAVLDFFPWGAADSDVLVLTNGSDTRDVTVLPTGIVEVGS